MTGASRPVTPTGPDVTDSHWKMGARELSAGPQRKDPGNPGTLLTPEAAAHPTRGEDAGMVKARTAGSQVIQDRSG
jgi:hypothetical protein